MNATVEYLLGMTVPPLSMVVVCLNILLSVVLPIAFCIYIKIKYKASLVAVLVGAVTFSLFALVLEQLTLALALTSIPDIQYNIPLFVIVTCLAAGLFEETGRFVAFSLVLRKRDKGVILPVAYGIGHGGIEAILLAGLAMINVLMNFLALGSGELAKQFAKMPEGPASDAAIALVALIQAPAIDLLAGGVERVIAMTFHICASIIVWLAVSKRGPFWLYPLSMLLHASLNVPAALYQKGLVSNIWLVEGVIGVFVCLVVLLTIKLVSHYPARPVAVVIPSDEVPNEDELTEEDFSEGLDTTDKD